MKRYLLPLLFGLLSLQTMAQQTMSNRHSRSTNSLTFLSPEELPNPARYIAKPPQPGDGAFENDIYYHNWGKAQRQTPRGEQAAIDEVQSASEAFSPTIGFNINREETPEIYKLVEGARRDARTINRQAKDYFHRMRPYVYFQEPSINPSTNLYISGVSSRFILKPIVGLNASDADCISSMAACSPRGVWRCALPQL